MQEYLVCECTPVEDNLIVCSPVRLGKAELEALYIGPTGAYAIVGENENSDAALLRGHLRTLCSTSRVCLYHRGTHQLLTPDEDRESALTDQELLSAIYTHTLHGPYLWSHEQLVRLQEKVRIEDAHNRGVYRDNEGKWFIARNGKFHPVSDHDPDRVLRLTLFGGIFGIHRFAIGNWFTGLLYLLTGGLMGLGWLMDLMQLSLGTLKDRKKRLLPKPEQVGLPWYLFGFAASFVLFCVYGFAAGILTGILNQVAQQAAQGADPEQASRILTFLQMLQGQ